MATVTNINDVLDGHVGLEIECVDRLYLNAYVPNLQVGGQVASFFTRHRGDPIPSPALMEKNGNRFRREVKAFAEANSVPILALKKPDRSRWDDRKLDHVRRHLENAERSGRFGVVAIVATQEFQWVFTAKNRSPKSGVVSYDFVKEERRVGTYYFYVLDADFGPGFIKLCTYFPYPAKGGPTGMSGPSVRPTGPVSPTRPWPMASPPAMTRRPCRRSAIGSAPPTWRSSSTAGWPSSRPR